MCYCPDSRSGGGGNGLLGNNGELFETLSQALGAVTGLITVYNFVMGRRRRKRRKRNGHFHSTSSYNFWQDYHLQECLVIQG